MSYKITHSYCWYNNRSIIVKMYFINNIAFTFDELTKIQAQNPEIIEEADKNIDYSPEELFLKSFYLIAEEAHPLLFEMDIENPEDLPQEVFDDEEEDLAS